MNNIVDYIINPDIRFRALSSRGFYNYLSDEEFLLRKFHAKLGYELDLNDPKTFNEKLQWLKLHDRNPIYTTMVDKYAVKDYVASIIGDQYIIPTLGVWERFEDINFASLPNQFVLKCSHDSGGLVIVKDKRKMNLKLAKKKISRSLKRNYYYIGREWPYKYVHPRIIAEEYLEEKEKGLPDYKVHCFNGIPRFILVCTDRFSSTGMKEVFYDLEWNKMEVSRPGTSTKGIEVQKPQKLEEMTSLASKLAANIPFVRVDLYEYNGNTYFGEMTFFPASGYKRFVPDKYDKLFGDMLILNS